MSDDATTDEKPKRGRPPKPLTPAQEKVVRSAVREAVLPLQQEIAELRACNVTLVEALRSNGICRRETNQVWARLTGKADQPKVI